MASLNILVGASFEDNLQSSLQGELDEVAKKLKKIPLDFELNKSLDKFSKKLQKIISSLDGLKEINITPIIDVKAIESAVSKIESASKKVDDGTKKATKAITGTTKTTKEFLEQLNHADQVNFNLSGARREVQQTSEVFSKNNKIVRRTLETFRKADGTRIRFTTKTTADSELLTVVARNDEEKKRISILDKLQKKHNDVLHTINKEEQAMMELARTNNVAFDSSIYDNARKQLGLIQKNIEEEKKRTIENINDGTAPSKQSMDMLLEQHRTLGDIQKETKQASKAEKDRQKKYLKTIEYAEETKQKLIEYYNELERIHMKNGTAFDDEPINKCNSELEHLIRLLNNDSLNENQILAINDRIGQISNDAQLHAKQAKQQEQDRLQILKKVTAEQERQHKKQLELTDSLRDMGKLSGGIFTEEALKKHNLTSKNLSASSGVIDNEASLVAKINGIKGRIQKSTTEQLFGSVTDSLTESGKELDGALAKAEKRIPIIKDGFKELGKIDRLVTDMSGHVEFLNEDDANKAKKEIEEITDKALKCLKVLSDPNSSNTAIKKATEDLKELNNQTRTMYQTTVGAGNLEAFDKIEKDRQKSLENARTLAESILTTFVSKQGQVDKYAGTEVYGDLLKYNEKYKASFENRYNSVIKTLKSETLSTSELANEVKFLLELQKEVNAYDKTIDDENARLNAVKKTNNLLDEQYEKIQKNGSLLNNSANLVTEQDIAETRKVYDLFNKINDELESGNVSLARRVELEKQLSTGVGNFAEYVKQREKEEKERRKAQESDVTSWWETKTAGAEYKGVKTDTWKKNIRERGNEISKLLDESFNQAYNTGFTEKHAKELDGLEAEYQDIIQILRKENVEVHELIEAFDRLVAVQSRANGVVKGIKSSVGASVDVDNALNKYNAETERLAVELRSKFGNLFNEAEFRAIRDVNKQISTLLKQHGYDLKQVNAILGSAKANTNQFKERLEATDREIKQINKNAEILDSSLGRFVQFYAFGELFRFGRDMARSMFEQIREVDSAMVELKKVTDESQLSYEKFLDKSSDKAKELGVTMSDYITSVTEFARAGQSFGDSKILAESANVMQMVAENLTAEQASAYLISTMAGFNIEAEKSMSIVDALNNVSNNFSITTDG